MNRRVHIESSKLTNKIEEYTKPEKIYIPLEDKNGASLKFLVKEGEYVYKGQAIVVNEKNNLPIHSSVSGYVSNEEIKILNNSREVNCLVIENDYKEKIKKTKIKTKEIEDITKEEFVELLKENGIVGLGGSGFPTYIKYDTDNIDYLLVNAVECEPFICCDKALIYNYAEEILEGISDTLDIMKIKKAIIVLKETSTKEINTLKKYIGTYPNITISTVKDYYPNGWERLVVKNTLGITYDKLPSEKGIIVSNVGTIYTIYEMLKYNRPLIERIITITGLGVKKKVNISVKIGALVSDIINNLDGYKSIKEPLFVAGGPMMGASLPGDDLIITKDLNCILVIPGTKEELSPCIKCGKCANVCPVNLYPVLIMKNIQKENNLKDLQPNKCIECGLCSYICPSKINVREYIKEAKDKVSK